MFYTLISVLNLKFNSKEGVGGGGELADYASTYPIRAAINKAVAFFMVSQRLRACDI